MNLRGAKGCKNNPGLANRGIGRCHVCVVQAARALRLQPTDSLALVEVDLTEIQFCPVCCHWFCGGHWYSLVERAWGAVKQLVKGAKPGCCGPVKGDGK